MKGRNSVAFGNVLFALCLPQTSCKIAVYLSCRKNPQKSGISSRSRHGEDHEDIRDTINSQEAQPLSNTEIYLGRNLK